jgi:hypothetical protein
VGHDELAVDEARRRRQHHTAWVSLVPEEERYIISLPLPTPHLTNPHQQISRLMHTSPSSSCHVRSHNMYPQYLSFSPSSCVSEITHSTLSPSSARLLPAQLVAMCFGSSWILQTPTTQTDMPIVCSLVWISHEARSTNQTRYRPQGNKISYFNISCARGACPRAEDLDGGDVFRFHLGPLCIIALYERSPCRLHPTKVRKANSGTVGLVQFSIFHLGV